MISALVTLLIYLLIIGIIVWLVLFIINTIPLPPPFGQVARVIVIVIACLVVILLLLDLLGSGLPHLRHLSAIVARITTTK